jgi:hypothetical protein
MWKSVRIYTRFVGVTRASGSVIVNAKLEIMWELFPVQLGHLPEVAHKKSRWV